MSTAPSINGISQLPKPPIKIGITIKKIIINACRVKAILYQGVRLKKRLEFLRLIRIIILRVKPDIPPNIPIIRYKVPIFLWLQEFNHLEHHFEKKFN